MKQTQQIIYSFRTGFSEIEKKPKKQTKRNKLKQKQTTDKQNPNQPTNQQINTPCPPPPLQKEKYKEKT